MNKLLAVLITTVGLSLVAADADAARRMGGGRNVGTQRQALPPQAPKAPAQQQAAPGTPAQQQAAPATPPVQQPSGMSRWLGPLAGLAIGAGLASLFMNNGMGGALTGMLLLAALVFGAFMIFRLVRGRFAPPQRPLQYAGASIGRSEPAFTPASPAPVGGAAPQSVAAATQWPADFNADEFVRHAKLNFVNLQAAHDRRDIEAIRDFLTPELAKDIEADMRASGNDARKTDVVTLEAEVLDVAAEQGQYIVSVRFSGLIRETESEGPQPFSEVWHLQKPVRGNSGWLVSGIQQA